MVATDRIATIQIDASYSPGGATPQWMVFWASAMSFFSLTTVVARLYGSFLIITEI